MTEVKSSPGGADLSSYAASSIDLSARRRAALRAVDEAPFSWFHVKTCLVAGVGFFTDAYSIFCVNLASVMLGYVIHHGGSLTANQDLALKVSTPLGTMIGQVAFGWLADQVGRKRMYGIELTIVCLATIAQAVAGSGPGVHLLGTLCMWRFIMGVGIGGDYPLSAVIASEYAAVRIRGRMMVSVFSAQGWGNLAAGIVGLVIVTCYKNEIINDPANNPVHLDPCWRLLIGLGAVPAALALYFRLTILETPRYTMDIERRVEQAANDIEVIMTGHAGGEQQDTRGKQVNAPKATRRDFLAYFSQWKNAKLLFACAYAWFALDVAYYGLGLNSALILSAIGYGGPSSGTPSMRRFTNLHNIATGNIILSVGGLIPGYWAAFFLVDSWGRKPVQLAGFSVLTCTLLIMGLAYHVLVEKAVGVFVFLYCLTNFFSNCGPNTTTFLYPGELFPTRYRATAHGISAGAGKAGAILAQLLAFKLKDIGGKNAFIPRILLIFSGFMLSGLLSSFLLPETKGRSLEELSNEEQDDFIK